MKTNINHEGMWWGWRETCDRCGKNVYPGYEIKSTREPDTEEVDFCYDCLMYFLDNDIPYKDMKKKYKRSK